MKFKEIGKAKKDFITVCLMAGNKDWCFRERLGCYVISRDGEDEWSVRFDGHLASVMDMKDGEAKFEAVDWTLCRQKAWVATRAS